MFTELQLIKSLNGLVGAGDYKPSVKMLVAHIVVDAVLLAMLLWVVQLNTLFALTVTSAVLPIFMFRCFGLMHDCVHGSALKSKIGNDIIGELAGIFCFLPYFQWRQIHLQHHISAGNIDNDPVMRLVRDFNGYSFKKKRILNFSWQSWLPIMGLLQHVVFWLAALNQTRSEIGFIRKMRCAASYALPGLVYLAVILSLGWSLFLFVPGVVLYLMMVEVINFPHHLGLPQNDSDKNLPFALQFKISRSCSYNRYFARWILNNFNFHSEHHIFPRLPWYKLDGIHKKVKMIVGDEYNESQGSEWIFKNRRAGLEAILTKDQVQMKSSA